MQKLGRCNLEIHLPCAMRNLSNEENTVKIVIYSGISMSLYNTFPELTFSFKSKLFIVIGKYVSERKNKSRQLMGNQHGISFVTMKTKYVLFFTTFAFHQYIFTPTLFFIFLILLHYSLFVLLQQRNIHILLYWS